MSDDGPIYRKFNVTRTDGTHCPGCKHDGCAYFVLDVTHDPYAKPALIAYATECRKTHPQLCDSIYAMLKEQEEADRE